MINRAKQLFFRLISFSKTEAKGTVVLFVLIGCCLVAPRVYIRFSGRTYDNQADRLKLDSLLTQIEAFRDTMVKPEVELKKFDPNQASVDDLVAVGIPRFLAQRIERYRNGGGFFRVRDDLSKIYDFPDSLFLVLEPFIDLPRQPIGIQKKAVVRKSESQKRNESARWVEQVSRFEEPGLMIDINKADSADFQQLHGIGPGYAGRMIKFREALGGFHSVEQLADLYGMSDSLYLQIRSFLHVADSVTLKAVPINIATFKQLNSHPYISYELTKEILMTKSKYGKFKTPEDLRRLSLLDSSTRMKLIPYIKF
ncbi:MULTISPECIES: helix-hairpin-helix domain-containing protein [Roseivirga]|uniref:Competence protein ComEA n=1 Tax=Roseivirga thermotolerans TaxID=1758176 RepID=A0ABQ3IBA9_9BACT|nr:MULTISPECIES: helix-hairpin-helix domain-containing protein [Roseivirga]GHE66849.1 competence protein ComEA [Roseivirga thermotolerans]|tara:strand:- start:759 stop:1691 length:933 start_codon:yes stop_codon:yes gene_type:complete